MFFSAMLIATALGQTPANPIVDSVKKELKDPAKPFVMFVTLKVKDGKAEAFETAAKPCIEGTLKEKGCKLYQFTRDIKNPNVYYIIEHWANLDALAAHLDMGHTKKLLAVMPDILVGDAEIKIMTPVGQ